MRGQRSLEINPHHPIIKALQQLVQKSEDDAGAKHSAALLYETALLESGFTPDNVKVGHRAVCVWRTNPLLVVVGVWLGGGGLAQCCPS